MNLNYLLVISLALALDAFGVALGIGLNPEVKFKNKIGFIFSFAFFQFLFAFVGGYGGILFSTYIASVPKILGGCVISLVGVIMIKEGMEKKKENILLNLKTNIILGISVSIDAMVIGFTVLNDLKSVGVLINCTIIIGIVTLIMTTFAFLISKLLNKIEVFQKYADYIGGIILLFFGIKMMFI
ncbi:hypothetical protein C3495_10700 [Clostridiaceae bacterium 14S0207]|nr:hypothetical protein C3495_10700 [Clostridiaceae bacterium 14S0207]